MPLEFLAKVTTPRIELRKLWSMNWLQYKDSSEQIILWTSFTFSHSFLHAFSTFLECYARWALCQALHIHYSLILKTTLNGVHPKLLSWFFRWGSWVSEQFSKFSRPHSTWQSYDFSLGFWLQNPLLLSLVLVSDFKELKAEHTGKLKNKPSVKSVRTVCSVTTDLRRRTRWKSLVRWNARSQRRAGGSSVGKGRGAWNILFIVLHFVWVGSDLNKVPIMSSCLRLYLLFNQM